MGRFYSQDKHMTIVIYVWLIMIPSNLPYPVDPSFLSRRTKKPYIDSCLKPLYNGTSLQRPRWSL